MSSIDWRPLWLSLQIASLSTLLTLAVGAGPRGCLHYWQVPLRLQTCEPQSSFDVHPMPGEQSPACPPVIPPTAKLGVTTLSTIAVFPFELLD